MGGVEGVVDVGAEVGWRCSGSEWVGSVGIGGDDDDDGGVDGVVVEKVVEMVVGEEVGVR